MSTKQLGMITLGFLLAGSVSIAAAATRNEKEVAKYTKLFHDAKDSKEKITALKELGRLGQIQVGLTKAVVPDILKSLDDKDDKVRAQAAHTIGMIDPEKKDVVIEKLIKMLKEEKEDSVKFGVAAGLAAMGPDAKEAVPALREAMIALREAMTKAGKKPGGVEYQMALQSITGKRK